MTNLGIQKLPLCHSLLYLNLSYTHIDDISDMSSCVNLRGVNLAGTQLKSYDPLKWLGGLEVLNLNFSSIETVGESFDHLPLLRSLDLGNTQLSSLRELNFLADRQLTRLEELYLDGVQAQGYIPEQRQELTREEVEQETRLSFHRFCDNIAFIDCLRVVNIGNSSFAKYAKYLRSKLSNDQTFVLVKPRSYYWFLNIINNDHEEVRGMILNGMNLNCRAGPAESDLFHLAWHKTCQGKTVFFDCLNEDPALRPTGLHLALLFNSVECVRLLVGAEALQDCPVWMGKVSEQADSETESDEEEELKEENDESDELTLTSEEASEVDGDSSLGSLSSDDLDSDLSEGEKETREEKREERKAQRKEERKDRQRRDRQQRKREKAAAAAAAPPPAARRRRASSLKPSSVASLPSSFSLGSAATRVGRHEDDGTGVSANAMALTKRLYAENVHRVTEKMTERRITGWKLMARGIMERLENILRGDPEEFGEDYQCAASVGTVKQVSVATERSKAQLVEAIKEDAAKKKLFSLEDIRKMYGSKRDLGQEEEEAAPVLAKDDPNVTDDDLFLANLRRDSRGDIVGTRGQFVSEDMIRLQLESAQSERASTVAASATVTEAEGGAKEGTGMFPELFAPGSLRPEGDAEDMSVLTLDSAEVVGADALAGLVADEFFPHVPALQQCLPWEPMLAKLTDPLVLRVYSHDRSLSSGASLEGEEESSVGRSVGGLSGVKASRYAVKQVHGQARKNPEGEPLSNALGMEYAEVHFLGKKSFWMESKRELLCKRVEGDEQKQREEVEYKQARWRNFVKENAKEDPRGVFGRDLRIARPMQLLHSSDGAPLGRVQRREKLAQLLRENRELQAL